MRSKMHPRIVANFFLDGAKILFGSLVVGAFVPRIIITEISLPTIILGVVWTAIFFLIANAAAHKEDIMKSNQWPS